MDKKFFTVAQFCQRYAVGRTKCYELINCGKLTRAKVGRRTLIAADSAENFARCAIGDGQLNLEL